MIANSQMRHYLQKNEASGGQRRRWTSEIRGFAEQLSLFIVSQES